MRTVFLNFHGIGRPARDLEPGEDRFWITVDSYRAILDEVARPREGYPPVRITFDDGNASDIEIGAPELAARGLTATFFALLGRIDTPGSLSAEDLSQLRSGGNRIGSHGYDHLDWRRLNAEAAEREFDLARAGLAQIIGSAIDEVAIPFGRYDRRVLTALRSRNYAAVYTSDRGSVAPGSWLRPRNCVRADTSVAAIRTILEDRRRLGGRVFRAAKLTLKRNL